MTRPRTTETLQDWESPAWLETATKWLTVLIVGGSLLVLIVAPLFGIGGR